MRNNTNPLRKHPNPSIYLLARSYHHCNDAKPGYYNGYQEMAQIICCAVDGKSCSRKTSKGQCYSGHGNDYKVTWHTAKNYCENIGKRLCNSLEELNQCCVSGCDYDNSLVWVNVFVPGI